MTLMMAACSKRASPPAAVAKEASVVVAAAPAQMPVDSGYEGSASGLDVLGARATQEPGGPTVRHAGHATVSGDYQPEMVQRLMRRAFPSMKLCYESALRSNPALAGKLGVEFDVDASGAIHNLRKSDGDFEDEPAIRCVLGVMRTVNMGAVVAPFRVQYGVKFAVEESKP